MQETITQPIGFFIEGDYMIVANPCTIPIKVLQDTLKTKRKKDQVTSYFMIKIPFNIKEEVKE